MVDISSTQQQSQKQKNVDEVDSLMDKYDKQEANANYLQSDEYKAKQKQKQDAVVAEEQKQVEELESTLSQLENTKELTKGQLTEKKMHAAEDDDFLQSLLQKYAQNGPSGIQVITKAKAYVAAAECVKRWRKLSGTEIHDYLKENFENTWSDHDVHKSNKIDITEAYSLMKEI